MGALPASADPSKSVTPQQLETIETRLSPSGAARFQQLTNDQKSEFVEAVNDPRFKDAKTLADLKEISPDFDESNTVATHSTPAATPESPGVDSLTAPVYEVESTWTHKSTFLGFSYATAALHFKYETSAGNVVADRACWLTVTDHVPFRTWSASHDHWVASNKKKGYCQAHVSVRLSPVDVKNETDELVVDGYRIVATNIYR